MNFTTGVKDGFGRNIELCFDEKISGCGGLSAAVSNLEAFGVLRKILEIADAFPQDRRNKPFHSYRDMIRQRLFALLAGKSDLNDADYLEADPMFLDAMGRTRLASAATLCRFEKTVTQEVIDKANEILLECYIRYSTKHRYVYLDVDNTPVPLYGLQEFKKFNGHYDCNCYLPLLAFIDGFPVGVFNGTIDGRKALAGQLERIVSRIRSRWKKSIIILRADSGFNSTAIIDMCEKLKCYYLIGLAKNKKTVEKIKELEPLFVKTIERPPLLGGNLISEIGEIDDYQASSWSGPRRIISRNYRNEKGVEDPRFIQTNIPRKYDGRCGKLWLLTAEDLYEKVYCQRGLAEQYNQEFKIQAFGARASSSTFLTNSWRMILGAFCQLSFVVLRRLVFRKGTQWNSVTLRRFRDSFVCVSVLARRLKTKTVLYLNPNNVLSPDMLRFWRVDTP